MPYRLLSKEISPSPSVVSRIRYVLKNYWLGSKLLFDNYQSVRQMRKKCRLRLFPLHFVGLVSPRAPTDLTRWEKIQLKEFRYDIRVGIPFVALFALPIVGYSAPLLALLAPKYLPSTLIQPTQKVCVHELVSPRLANELCRYYCRDNSSKTMPKRRLA